jgi:hypothetical protein
MMMRITMWDGTRLAVPTQAGWQRGHIDPPRGWDIACYVQDDSTVLIPHDCQADPEGEEGRWVDAESGAPAVVELNGVPRLRVG